jgi:hypothetical protein
MDNQLHLATFQHILHLAGDQPQQIIYGVIRSQASVEWNELEIAEQQGNRASSLPPI